MIKEVLMPKLGQTMTEGTVEHWLKKEGERVEKGEILLEISSDKAVLEVESPVAGILKKIVVAEGKTVPVKEVIAYIGEERDAAPAVSPPPAEKTVEAKDGGEILASPRARRLAGEKGIDLRLVTGSGPGGRISEEDIVRYAAGPAVPPVGGGREGESGGEQAPLSRMRSLIARRVSLSKTTIPHFYLTGEVDMTACREKRREMTQVGRGVSYLDFIVRAVARALKDFPRLNSIWENDGIRFRRGIDVGVVVEVEDGVVIPAVRDAGNRSLAEISGELKMLIDRARQKQLLPDQTGRSTFTVSNLGMFGVENFFAVINPGESAILAVGEIKDAPAVRGGEITVRAVMKLSLSCDHRTVDGATAARFLGQVKESLEKPETLL